MVGEMFAALISPWPIRWVLLLKLSFEIFFNRNDPKVKVLILKKLPPKLSKWLNGKKKFAYRVKANGKDL